MKQIHNLDTFVPKTANELLEEQKQSAVPSLMFLTEIRDKSIKARKCTGGKKQKDYIPKEKAASSKIMLESILITATVEAVDKRKVAVIDLPGALVHTKNDREVLMKMEGKLDELTVKM